MIGDLYHLTDECMIGFTLDFEKNEISFFDYNDCDFSNYISGDNSKITGDKYYKYLIPNSFEELLDLLYKHEFIFIDEGKEIDIPILIKRYNDKLDDYKILNADLHNKIVLSEKITMLEKMILINILNNIYISQYRKGFYKSDAKRMVINESLDESYFEEFIKPILL
jgi:hypothetical protein